MSTAGILHMFEDEFWNRNMDPRVRGFPFMDDGFPWKMISVSLIYLLLVKYWNPKFKNIDLRPYLLIQNGFLFGCHGAGLPIAFLLSNMGREGFDCNFDVMISQGQSNEPTFDFVKSQSIVRLATVLLFLRMFMMTETIVLHKIMNGRQPSLLRVANDIVLFYFSYIGCKYLPGGPSLFFALAYISFYTFTYGYYTLRCGYNTNNNDHSLVLKWKKVFILLTFVWSMLSLAHFVYLITTPSCTSRTNIRSLCFLELLHAAGTLISAVTAYSRLSKYHSE